jgi:hypothetical protein
MTGLEGRKSRRKVKDESEDRNIMEGKELKAEMEGRIKRQVLRTYM